MLNNVGLPGLLLFFVLFAIWLIVRPSRKAKEQKRIADALEEIAKNNNDSKRN